MERAINSARATAIIACAIVLGLTVANALGQTAAVSQSSVVTVSLAQDQIASLKTARGITTRLVFGERVQEIICGDLYDPASGIGTFVIQRVGNEVFLKPVVAEGVSNLFVKTGENSETTYSFDLVIGGAQQAFRIVRIVPPTGGVNPHLVTASPKSSNRPPLTKVEFTPEFGQILPAGLPETIKPLALTPPPPASVGVTASVRSLPSSKNSVPGERKVLRRVKPVYPDSARRNATYGEVEVQVQINNKGEVTSAKALSGNLMLRSAAIEAARSWKFEPFGKEGSSEIKSIMFNFILEPNLTTANKNKGALSSK